MSGAANTLVGRTLNGTYEVLQEIGAGGMGAIYEVQHTRLAGKRYALKTLHPGLVSNEEVFLRFRREAEIASGLGNDHIVDVIDFNTAEDGLAYMVMELLSGHDLSDRIRQVGRMPLPLTARILTEACNGLQAAHDAGIVHRDLKPPNIYLCNKLGRDDFIKILDFGVSKVHDSSSVVTRDQTLMGTPNYMSPEQADGHHSQIDNRTDIFALGAIGWEMLSGKMAFSAPTVSGTIYQVVHVTPPEVHSLRGDIPVAVSQVLARALAKNKADRFPNITEFGQAFAHALTAPAAQVAVPGGTTQLGHESGSHLPASNSAAQLGTAPTVPPVIPQLPATSQPSAYPRAGSQPAPYAQAPGSYPQAPGSYPQAPGSYPQAPGSYPQAPGSYPQAPGSHPQEPISTLSSAAGQHGQPATTNQSGKKGGLIVAVVLLIALGGGAGAFFALAGKGDSSAASTGERPDATAIAAAQSLIDAAPAPKAPAIPIDAAPTTKPKSDPPASDKPPVAQPSTVTITFRLSVKLRGVSLLLDGKPVHGRSITVPRSDTPLKVTARARRFEPRTITFVPNKDQVVKIPPLRRKRF